MTKKDRRSLAAVALAYVYLASCGSVFSAASGNYTDLLPIGAPGNTTVISNGSGWSLTTLPPTQTFGDALSRSVTAPFQVYTSSTIATSATVSTFTALVSQSRVGSTTFPAAWVATGRSIRVTVRGKYGTTSTPTWTWGLSLGTTSVLTTGALNAPTTVTDMPFSESCLMTVAATGAAGTVNASCDVFVTTAAASTAGNFISYSTTTAAAVSVDLTSQLTVNPTFKWGTSNAANTITANNVVVEFLN